jgi:hypothetical protein
MNDQAASHRTETTMNPTQNNLAELKQQLAKGSIQKGYRALISFMMGLQTHFAKKFGESAVSALYQGYMDMTYFALFPPALKQRGLKVAVVFNYEAFQFEAWLAARNRKLQRETWEYFKDSKWSGCRVVEPAVGVDAIIECTLASGLDLADPDALTVQIENAAARFTADLESFLAGYSPGA